MTYGIVVIPVLPSQWTQTVTKNTNLIHYKQLDLVDLHHAASIPDTTIPACKYTNF